MTSRSQRIDVTGGDEAALLISACCLVHCMAWPFVLTALPAIFNDGGLIHRALGGLAILLALLVLGAGYECHRQRPVIGCGVLGIALLSVSLCLPADCCSAVSEALAGKLSLSSLTAADWGLFLLAPLGTILLGSAHLWNRRLLAQCTSHRRRSR
jgi:hypothetical protein